MQGIQNIRWLVVAFAFAGLAAATTHPTTALAQSRPQLVGPPDPGANTPLAEPNFDEPGDASGAPTDFDAERDDADADAPKRAPADQPRRAPVDGNLAEPEEQAAPVDAAPEPADAVQPVDGWDASIDTREPEDRALFENVEDTPAGYDPLLFQIEDLRPIENRRTDRLFRLEPYDPIGMKFGSFVYFPEAELAGLYNSNVFSSPVAERDVAFDLTTSSRLVSNWSRHALELRSTSNWSFYDEYNSENDKDYELEARGRLDFARRSNLQGSISHERAQESRSAIDAQTAGTRPNIDVDSANLTLTHAFNRLEVQVRASLSDEDIGNARDGFGGIVDNNDRDRRTDEEYVRLTYEFKPSFSVFAEGGINTRDYKIAAYTDGLSRDSDGQRYRIGFDFGDEGQILRGEFSLGYGVQNPDESSLGEVEGLLFDSNVTWRVSELTALRLSGRTDIYDTTTPGSGGVLSHEIGLEARHAFLTYLVGTAGITYTVNDYEGVDIKEDEFRLNLDAEYYASRELILFGAYQHTEFSSNLPEDDWNSDEFRVGVRVRR